MFQDMDGNEIIKGMRVAAAENLCGVKIRFGIVTGYTAQRVKIQFEEDVKESSKAPHTIVKVFKQERL